MTLSLLDSPPEDPQPTDTTLPAPAGWPAPPAPAVYHELLGEIVTTIAPHTEADPVAILTQMLVAFGAAVGRGAHFQVEATHHHANEFMLLVGDSSKARKGSSWDHVRRLMADVDASIGQRTLTGLSSGEGLIWAVRDPTAQDPGIGDQRLLVIEPEFASVLKASGREISTLSPTLRCASDGRPLAILTRTAPARATSAHIALIGHITQTELRRYTTTIELSNGYLNRILLIACRRQRLLPEGGRHDPLAGTGLPRLLAATHKHAQTAGQIRLDADARELWHHAYQQLSQPRDGSSARSPPAPKRTRSGSRSSTRSPTVPSRSARRTCTPRSRCTTTPPDPRAGHSNAQQARCSPSRSTPRYDTTRPA